MSLKRLFIKLEQWVPEHPEPLLTHRKHLAGARSTTLQAKPAAIS